MMKYIIVLLGVIFALFAFVVEELKKPQEKRWKFDFLSPRKTDASEGVLSKDICSNKTDRLILEQPKKPWAPLLIVIENAVLLFFAIKEKIMFTTLSLYFSVEAMIFFFMALFFIMPFIQEKKDIAFLNIFKKDTNIYAVIAAFAVYGLILYFIFGLGQTELLVSDIKKLVFPFIFVIFSSIARCFGPQKAVNTINSLFMPLIVLFPVILVYVVSLLTQYNLVIIISFLLIKTFLDLFLYKNIEKRYQSFI